MNLTYEHDLDFSKVNHYAII